MKGRHEAIIEIESNYLSSFLQRWVSLTIILIRVIY